LTNSSNRFPSLLSSLPLLTPSNQENQKTMVFSEPSQSFKWSSYGTLTLAAITACPLLVEPAQAWENRSAQDDSGAIAYSEAEPQPMVKYEIQPGDTLWELAQTYQTSPEKLAQYNGVESEGSLQVGTTIIIPTGKTANINQSQLLASHDKKGQTVTGRSTSENLEIKVNQPQTELPETIPQTSSSEQQNNQSQDNRLAKMEPLETDSLEAVANQPLTLPNSEQDGSQQELVARAPLEVNFSNPFDKPIGKSVSPELPPLSSPDQYLPNGEQTAHPYIWPAEGIFTSGYGQRWGRMHKGVDIAAPIGTPVVAADAGEVVFAGWMSGFGKLIKLRHSDDSLTLYAHNNRILVQPGEQVQQGERIAEMGNTGRSTGPHLHFELHPADKQQAVNPLTYLPEGEKIRQGQKVYKMGRKPQ